MSEDQLVIPVYIDDSVLLDLLATIQNGFSFVEKVTSNTSANQSTDENKRSLKASLNISSFLQISADPSKTVSATHAQDTNKEITRYHTHGSLLNQLRSYLVDNNLIRVFSETNDNWNKLDIYNFIEVSGILRPNPLKSGLNTILMIYESLINTSSVNEKTQATMQFFEKILKDLSYNNIELFVIDFNIGGITYSSVIPIFLDKLRDNTQIEISHKHYKVLGKILMKINENEEEKIDLSPGTGFSGLGEKFRTKFQVVVDSYNNIGFNLPANVATYISGPALQILPIAIYA